MKNFCLILLSELKFGKRYEEILDFIQGKAEGSGSEFIFICAGFTGKKIPYAFHVLSKGKHGLSL